jgi:superfamily II DNA helicase RecQ
MSDRDTVLTAWYRGTDSPMVVSASALSAGVDYTSVRLIPHLDAPITYSSRDGAPADCLIMLPPGWRITWGSGFYSNFLTEDCMRMTNFL